MTVPFHLAIPVDDLAAARRFYGEVLGCPEGRSAPTWIDFDLMGHQLVVHQAPRAAITRSPVDGDAVPVPHFGIVLDWPAWEALGQRIAAHGVGVRAGAARPLCRQARRTRHVFPVRSGRQCAGIQGDAATPAICSPSRIEAPPPGRAAGLGNPVVQRLRTSCVATAIQGGSRTIWRPPGVGGRICTRPFSVPTRRPKAKRPTGRGASTSRFSALAKSSGASRSAHRLSPAR